jgi:hypothetical protein
MEIGDNLAAVLIMVTALAFFVVLAWLGTRDDRP